MKIERVMMSGWLDAADWKRAQATIPIACIDILPVQLTASQVLGRIGLIYRDTPHQGRRWCVVGGRLWRNESIAEAIARQLRETLGDRIGSDIGPDPQPAYVSQYFAMHRNIGSFDPRQHALTLNFVVPLTGEPKAGGEAADFRWFAPSQLPSPEEFGFGQDKIVASCTRAFQAVQRASG